MDTVTSADGTAIAFTRAGTGPALLLVDGAMCYRGMGPMPALAERLTDHFTVYTFDRRGRGESGDTAPFAVEREIEDLEALVAHAGGTAYGYAMSSGAALAIRAAAAGVPWRALALYEPPFTGPKQNYSRELGELLAAGRRGDAVERFLTVVGTPAGAIAGMRVGPGWPLFESIAPTLAYDDAALGDGSVPRDEAALVKVPTIVLDGGASPAIMRAAATTAAAIPQARRVTLAGQTHDVAPDALAPVLVEFFSPEGQPTDN
jgi:pimeloyl-ACP methyl ester carboxylesterase